MPRILVYAAVASTIIAVPNASAGARGYGRFCRADELVRLNDRWEYVETHGFYVGYMSISALGKCLIPAEEMVYTLHLNGKKLKDPSEDHPPGLKPRGIVWYLIRECGGGGTAEKGKDTACIAVKVRQSVFRNQAAAGEKAKITFEVTDPVGNSVKLHMDGKIQPEIE